MANWKSGISYKIHGMESFPVAGHINPSFYKNNLEYKVDPTDTILASFPKCGTTWVQFIMHLMHNNLVPPTKEELFWMRRRYYLEYYLGKEHAEKLKQPRHLKTHLSFELVPYNSKAKYIYITRNPFDCCVSMHRFISGMKDYEFDLPFDQFFYRFLEASNMWGDYFKHVMSWYAHRNDENVLFLVYEQMIENPGEQIIKIGQFLGGDCEKLVSDSETVDVIKKLSNFDSMKEGDSINFEKTHITKENFSFFRKGKIGDYKNVLTDRQQELLSEKYKMWFKGTFLIDIWRPYVPQ